MRLPPDYRLFLNVLHCVDRPLHVIRFNGFDPFLVDRPAFYHWQNDTAEIQRAYEWVVEGLVFDAVHNRTFWRASWGAKPTMEDITRTHLQALISTAPKLIPILGHRFLLGEPSQAGNPVLSSIKSSHEPYYGSGPLLMNRVK